MTQRLLWVAGGVLLVVNLGSRLVWRLVAPDSQTEVGPGVTTYGLTLLAAAGVALWWLRRRWSLLAVLREMTLGVLVAAAIITAVGPAVSGGGFSDGALINLLRAGLLVVVCYAGIGLGLLGGVALGWDMRSHALRAYAAKITRPAGARPRRR